MLNVSGSPSASLAYGVYEYDCPAMTLEAGEPVIVGARFGASVTVMPNGASSLKVVPSVTLITMPEFVPIWAADGVPLSRPLEASKVAHVGLPATAKLSTSPSGSLALGVNEYDWPATTVVAGWPLMSGASLGVASTWMANGASEAEAWLSDTLITIFW